MLLGELFQLLTFSGFESWSLLVSVICLLEVNQIDVGFVEGPNVDNVGSLTSRHVVRRLLKLHHRLVAEPVESSPF